MTAAAVLTDHLGKTDPDGTVAVADLNLAVAGWRNG